jgi:hypothetical protein
VNVCKRGRVRLSAFPSLKLLRGFRRKLVFGGMLKDINKFNFCSGAHPASYPMVTGSFSLRGKVAGA